MNSDFKSSSILSISCFDLYVFPNNTDSLNYTPSYIDTLGVWLDTPVVVPV